MNGEFLHKSYTIFQWGNRYWMYLVGRLRLYEIEYIVGVCLLIIQKLGWKMCVLGVKIQPYVWHCRVFYKSTESGKFLFSLAVWKIFSEFFLPAEIWKRKEKKEINFQYIFYSTKSKVCPMSFSHWNTVTASYPKTTAQLF